MNTEQFLDYAAQRCREHGTRLTPIRRQVLQRVADQPGYCKAYDLLEQLRPEIASLTAPTIYRALEFLETEGLVHRLDVVNGYVACQQHDHDAQTLFLICPCCGKVAEAKSDDSGFFSFASYWRITILAKRRRILRSRRSAVPASNRAAVAPPDTAICITPIPELIPTKRVANSYSHAFLSICGSNTLWDGGRPDTKPAGVIANY